MHGWWHSSQGTLIIAILQMKKWSISHLAETPEPICLTPLFAWWGTEPGFKL